MDSLARDSQQAGRGLGVTDRVAESVGETLEDTARDSRSLARGLDEISDEAAGAVASLTAVRAAATGVDRNRGASVVAGAETGRARQALRSVRETARTLDATTASVEVGTDGVPATIAQLETTGAVADALDATTAEVGVETAGIGDAVADVTETVADTDTAVDVDADGTSATQRALSSVQSQAARIRTTPATTHVEAEGVGDTLSQLAAVRAAQARAGGDIDIDTDTGTHIAAGALGSPVSMPNIGARIGDTLDDADLDLDDRLGGLSIPTPDIGGSISGPDAEDVEALEAIPDAMRDMPDLSFDTDLETPAELVDSLSLATEEATEAAGSLREMGDAGDELVDSVDSLPGLIDGLGDLDLDMDGEMDMDVDPGEFEALSGASADLVDDALAGAGSVDALETQIDDSGDSAVAAAVQMEGFEGQLGDVTTAGLANAASMHEAADEIEDVGDKSTASAAQVTGLTGALAGLGATDVGVNIAGISGSLSTMGKVIGGLLPAIGSLVTALGGLGTAGGVAAGGLGALFAGGLLSEGERLAETSSEIQENLREENDGGMPSDMQESIAGATELLSRFKDQAFEALEPLRQAEFGDFAMDALSGALEVISDLSTAAARLSDPLLEMADTVGAAFWDTHPDFIASLMSLTRSLLPVVEDLIVYLIESLPSALQFMESTGEDVLPVLGEFLTSLMELIPPIVDIGTAVISALFPALNALMPLFTGVAEGAAAILVPALTTLGDIIGWLGDLFGGILGPIAESVGVFIGAAGTAAALSSLLGTLATVITTALVPAISAIGTALLGALGPWSIAIGLAAAIISHFDLWEPILNAAKSAWNGLMDTISSFSGGVFDWLEGAINSTIGAINMLIGVANQLPQVEFGDVGQVELPDEVDASGMKMDGAAAETPTPNGQAGGGGGPGGGPGSDQYASDREAVAGTNIEKIEVNAGDGDERRIKRAVRQAVDEKDHEQRRRTTPRN